MAKSVVESDELWASHIATMNDAEERIYGWRLIVDRIEETAGNYPTEFAQLMEVVAGIVKSDLPASRIYVVSASTLHDDLSQFRAYGDYELAIRGGYWFAPDHPGGHGNAHAWAVWRPVLYGPEQAIPYIDRMFAAITHLGGRTGFRQPFQQVVRWCDYLAALIKHPAFTAESEVRLLLHSNVDTLYVQTHIAGNRIVPDVILRSGVDGVGCINGLHLGPSAGGELAMVGATALLSRNAYLDMVPTLSLAPFRRT